MYLLEMYLYSVSGDGIGQRLAVWVGREINILYVRNGKNAYFAALSQRGV